MSPTVVSRPPTPDQMAKQDGCSRFRMVEPRCGQADTDSSRHGRGMGNLSENSDAVSMDPISPELALVDPELGARARAALGDPVPPPRAALPVPPEPVARRREHRPYPFWARVTAALWLLVLGILIGGAAIPHAQDTPRVVPQDEDARFCRAPVETPTAPAGARGVQP
jgi:hypothetical protein